MSTVVYHAESRTMAADSRGYSGDQTPIGAKIKVFRLRSGPYVGGLLGVTTSVVGAGELVCSVLEMEQPDETRLGGREFVALLVLPNGEVYLAENAVCFSGPLEAPYYAIGSGKKFALGALDMKASAERAVQAAINNDIWSGPPIRAWHLDAENSDGAA